MRADVETVDAYLESLPAERRQAIAAVRAVILKNLPTGYEEAMAFGMISYQVPLATYPDTYNKRPLQYAALASQKNYMALYLMGIYLPEAAAEFERRYRATGKRNDVGKSCVRFRTLDDLPLDLIGETIQSTSVHEFVDNAKAVRASRHQERA